MIKYFKNGVLEVDTLDLPQDCGEIKVSITLEEEREDANYYLEFACPRNVKYISQKLVRVADKEYELILPRGISEYIGEVYVQLLIMSVKDAVLISRSLIARNPLFVIKESILASSALDSSDRRDFFEYAQKIVSDAQEKIDIVEQMIVDIPNQIVDSVENEFNIVTNALADMEDKVDDKIDKVKTDLSNACKKIDLNTEQLTNNTTKLAEHEIKLEEIDGCKQRLDNIEEVLPQKLNIDAVNNEYSNQLHNVYSTNYINDNFERKINKGEGAIKYDIAEGFSNKKVASFTIPASGYMILSAYTAHYNAKPTMLSIKYPISGNLNTVTSTNILDDCIGVTMCTKVEKNHLIDFYVSCLSGGSSTNTVGYRYIIVEG